MSMPGAPTNGKPFRGRLLASLTVFIVVASLLQWMYNGLFGGGHSAYGGIDFLFTLCVGLCAVWGAYLVVTRTAAPPEKAPGAAPLAPSDPPAELAAAVLGASSAAREGIAVIEVAGDFLGKFLYVNDEVCRLLRRSREELVGRPYAGFLTPESMENVVRWDQEETLQTSFGGFKLVEAIAADGERVPIELSLAARETAGRELTVLFVRDVRERRRQVERLEEYATHLERVVSARTEELIESERKRRLIMDSMDDVVVSLDLEGRFTYVNAAWDRQVGTPREHLLGQNFTREVHPDDREHLEKLFAETVRTRAPVSSAEFRHRAKDGQWRTFKARSSLLYDLADAVAGIVVVGRDITAEKEMEKWLAHTERMESVGLVASGLAHDFNNLFHEVLGFTGRIRRHPHAEAGIKRDAQSVEAIIERATGFMRQLLSFAASQEKKDVLFDIVESARRIVALVEPTFPPSVHIECDFASRQFIDGDPNQFDQVFLNLLLNARDALPEGGTIRVSSHDLEAPSELPVPLILMGTGRYVVVEVADGGMGIPAEIQAKIFDPFFTTKPVGKGTGLGLSTVYGVIRNHGGVISVESEPGKGAKFTICLPAVAAPGTRKGTAAQPLTVLFADDTEEICRLTAEALEEEGFRALTAKNGREAVELFRSFIGEIGVVVMDMVMPEMDGLAAAQAMHRLNPRVRVILSTGQALTLRDERVQTSHIHHILHKPYSLDDLVRAIREVDERGREG
ncbi:MAG: PAS domain-containing sensor histidine kinase [Myxococcales bacterium]|nr:MAG: PAS domain-containing sensor histidine kinase [Myxococcales bacterium]